MCLFCPSPAALHEDAASEALSHRWTSRRAFVLAGGAVAATAAVTPALAQVDVGPPSRTRTLVPASTLEQSGSTEYANLLRQAQAQRALAPATDPQLRQLHAIARRIIPYTAKWNDRAKSWRWEVNLLRSQEINAFCMPGGKIAFYTGILDRLKLSEDEIAMIMGHEMAHALREHARERLAKTAGTSMALQLGAQLLGLGQLGDLGARASSQLLSLKFSRDDETEADLVGLELAAQAGFRPQAAVSLWQKMSAVSGGSIGFLSTHPSGPNRIAVLERNLPKVEGLYRAARR